MAYSALGPRVLLRRLREVMAEPETAQKRLDKIAQLIAANMVAEVCSIYVMRPGQILELYATEGLKLAAVHKSKLKVGEGLVGLIGEQAQKFDNTKPLNSRHNTSQNNITMSCSANLIAGFGSAC